MWLLTLSFAGGFLIGALFIYLIRAAKITALTEQLAAEKNTKEKLQNDFKLAASEALQNANQQFLSSALKDLQSVRNEANMSVDHKKQEIQASVTDMKERLDEYQRVVRKFEDERSAMYTKVDQQLAQVLSAEQSIRMETMSLKRVLTTSAGVRGNFGQKILQEILEQSDLVRGINFDTQLSITGGSDNELRPDFVIYLPQGKRLVIDAKEVTSEYVLAQETEDVEKQRTHYEKLVSNIRSNFNKLSQKEYQSFVDRDIPFVVMFIPSEAAIRAAFMTAPNLFQEATEKKVILASPMTIIPLIYLVSHSWQQHRLAHNAQELGNAVEELGNRLYKFVEHLQGIQSGIKKTVECWEKAVGSWQSRVSPQIEKARTLGGKLKETEDLSSVDTAPRAIADPHKEEPACQGELQ